MYSVTPQPWLQANKNQFYQVWGSPDPILMNNTQNLYYRVHWFHGDVINQKEKYGKTLKCEWNFELLVALVMFDS